VVGPSCDDDWLAALLDETIPPRDLGKVPLLSQLSDLALIELSFIE
jgi:hypothetical protein